MFLVLVVYFYLGCRGSLLVQEAVDHELVLAFRVVGGLDLGEVVVVVLSGGAVIVTLGSVASDGRFVAPSFAGFTLVKLFLLEILDVRDFLHYYLQVVLLIIIIAIGRIF